MSTADDVGGGIVECEDRGLVGAASTDQDVEVGSIVPVGPQHPVWHASDRTTPSWWWSKRRGRR